MKLNQSQIQSFQSLWKSEMKEDLTEGEAEQYAKSVIELLAVLSGSSKKS